MQGKYQFIICLCCLILWMFGLASGKEPADPASAVQSLLKAVKVLSEAKESDKTLPIVKEISKIFDLVGVSQACLHETWQKLSVQERKTFVNLFQEVLEKVAYPKSAKFFKNTEIEVEDVTKDGNRAEITTLVVHPEEGEVEVGFCLKIIKGKWLIEDILLDGISLRIDLRSQMQKIIRENSYKELKRRLREKLDS